MDDATGAEDAHRLAVETTPLDSHSCMLARTSVRTFMAAAAPDATPLVLRVKRLSEHAVLPVRGSAGAAGYDLAAYDPPPLERRSGRSLHAHHLHVSA